MFLRDESESSCRSCFLLFLGCYHLNRNRVPFERRAERGHLVPRGLEPDDDERALVKGLVGDLDAYVAANAGVVAVFTAKDVPGVNRFGVIPALADQPVFAEGEARFRGEAVEMVVGETDAVRALDLFIAGYGAFAGNMALSTLSRGGVYIAGGIARQIAAKLGDGSFVRAFTGKGRFEDFLRRYPVHIVTDPKIGLKGALQVLQQND